MKIDPSDSEVDLVIPMLPDIEVAATKTAVAVPQVCVVGVGAPAALMPAYWHAAPAGAVIANLPSPAVEKLPKTTKSRFIRRRKIRICEYRQLIHSNLSRLHSRSKHRFAYSLNQSELFKLFSASAARWPILRRKLSLNCRLRNRKNFWRLITMRTKESAINSGGRTFIVAIFRVTCTHTLTKATRIWKPSTSSTTDSFVCRLSKKSSPKPTEN